MKPKTKSFTRHIYSYDKGNFDLLREKASSFDWNTLQDDDIDIYASNIENKLILLSRECIPNKKRKAQVLHTRLRTGCSSLNLDLFLKSISFLTLLCVDAAA